MFTNYDDKGNVVRNRVTVDCSKDEIITEQSHKDEVNINNIVKRHGLDMIQKTAMLQTPEYYMDDNPGNDFQEAMFKVTRAKQTFDSLPSKIRKEFDNNPGKFMDFVHNPENTDQMIKMGLARPLPKEPAPIKVEVTNTATAETSLETPAV